MPFRKGDRVRLTPEGESVLLYYRSGLRKRHRSGAIKSKTGTVMADCRKGTVVSVLFDSAPDVMPTAYGCSYWELIESSQQVGPTEPQVGPTERQILLNECLTWLNMF